jgi:membrane-bound lytic murein transglycosylase
MKVHILKPEFKEKIRLDDDLVLKIAKANGVRYTSVTRWILDDSKMITTATNIAIVKDHLNLNETEILTQEADILA